MSDDFERGFREGLLAAYHLARGVEQGWDRRVRNSNGIGWIPIATAPSMVKVLRHAAVERQSRPMAQTSPGLREGEDDA